MRRPSPPTTSPMKRMLAGASGTAHTLAQRGDERAPARRRPASRRPGAASPRRGLRRPRSARGRAAAGVGRAGRRPALDPARRAAAAAAAGLRDHQGGGAGRPALRHRRRHRADPQPARQPACSAPTCRAAWPSSASTWASSRPWSSRASCWPTRSPTRSRRCATTSRRSPDSANQRLADVQDYFDRKGINVEIKKQGQTALETLQEKVVGGTDSVVSFGTDLLTKIVTAGFGLILVFVLSVYMLIHGERIGALVRGVMPPGDGTREDDYPSRVVRAVAGLRARPAALQLRDGCGRRHRAVDLRRRRDLPRRQDLRAGLRRVVRAHGARALCRPVPGRRAAAAGGALPGSADRACGWRCSSSGCSRSRATSPRR